MSQCSFQNNPSSQILSNPLRLLTLLKCPIWLHCHKPIRVQPPTKNTNLNEHLTKTSYIINIFQSIHHDVRSATVEQHRTSLDIIFLSRSGWDGGVGGVCQIHL